MQLRHAVGALAEAQPHDGHVEHARLSTGVVLRTEGQQTLDRDALDGVGATEEEVDLFGREAVDARRNRGVRGEHGRGPDGFQGLIEVESSLRGDQFADPLDAEEAGVTFVGVVDVRRRSTGQA